MNLPERADARATKQSTRTEGSVCIDSSIQPGLRNSTPYSVVEHAGKPTLATRADKAGSGLAVKWGFEEAKRNERWQTEKQLAEYLTERGIPMSEATASRMVRGLVDKMDLGRVECSLQLVGISTSRVEAKRKAPVLKDILRATWRARAELARLPEEIPVFSDKALEVIARLDEILEADKWHLAFPRGWSYWLEKNDERAQQVLRWVTPSGVGSSDAAAYTFPPSWVLVVSVAD